MEDLIQRILAVAPGPMTSDEISDELRREGSDADQHLVLEALLKLQKKDSVALEDNRWRLLVFVEIPDAPENRTIASKNTPSIPRSNSGPMAAPKPLGRWPVFRKLCRYYIDCLVQDQSIQLSAFSDNRNETWIDILSSVPWTRLAQGRGFTIPFPKEKAAFQRNRARRRNEDTLFIGYPIVLVRPPGDGSPFLVPILIQPVTGVWDEETLHLEPAQELSLNSRWLNYHFKKKPERDAFLTQMQFLPPADSTEPDTPSPPKDFAITAQRISKYIFDKNKFAEEIDPNQLHGAINFVSDRDGLHNSAILQLGPALKYTRSLVSELGEIAEKWSDEDLDRSALAHLFPHTKAPSTDNQEESNLSMTTPSDTSDQDFKSADLLQTRLLHPAQRASVQNAMSRPASVVTGPPGTGKSEVVSSMLLNQLIRGRPTLFSSKNHQALEAVIPRLTSPDGGSSLVLQASARDLTKKQDYLSRLRDLLSKPARPDLGDREEIIGTLMGLFGRQTRALSQLDDLQLQRGKYDELNKTLDQLVGVLPPHLQSDDSISSWPLDFTDPMLVKHRDRLHRLSSPPRNWFQRLVRRFQRDRIRDGLRELKLSLTKLPDPCAGEPFPKLGKADALNQWDKIFDVWIRWEKASRALKSRVSFEKTLENSPDADSLNTELRQIQAGIHKHSATWIQWASGGSCSPLNSEDHEVLANLRAGIETWGESRFHKELRKDFHLILKSFPLWSVSNLSAKSAFPLVPGLFDLLVVDEASQCDIPSVVPLLARSRRVVFAGDPMQLTHVSSLNKQTEQTLLTRHGLVAKPVQRFSYGVNNAFNLGNDARDSLVESDRILLNLHFRSHEAIADYCNEAFYSKALNVVTRTSELRLPPGIRPGIHWSHVSGSINRGRPSGAWCAEEIEVVISELVKLAETDFDGTIGVVSPFTQQSRRLNDAIESNSRISGSFARKTQLGSFTAHGLQGGERDLIIYSLCGGPDLHAGGQLFFSKNPNQFNVAVSRARAVLHIVGNRDWAVASGNGFLQKLAIHSEKNEQTVEKANQHTAAYESPWEKKLDEALKQAGIETIPQYPIAGRRLDLAVLNSIKLDIEVDGEEWHRTDSGKRKDDDHWRDIQLQSLGWTVQRFWVYQLREDMPGCIEKIKQHLRND